ncbi:ankyrin repeat domain-containing protein 60 [Python bivittatus]|uniref:Ankyrin repeat domain-containing protein 60 n=1 Tax=Python bivittatus TaxID=176946 RepID=A0A9F5IZ25_PYTBI|nr:ankyrin repeat domain-containing protein 60 [Python bivittatus]
MQSKRKQPSSTNPYPRTGTNSRILWQRPLRIGELVSPQSRLFNVKLQIIESEEVFALPECHRDLTVRSLKSRLELFVGIPVNFQRIQYLDEVDLDDDSTLRRNEIVPGGTLTMRIWSEDSWGGLVAAATSGRIRKLQSLGATQTSSFSTANSDLMTEEERIDWLAHRAFVALFITAHRGHTKAVEFLLQNGADLKRRTPLGRTALHVAVTSGQIECISLLLDHGAKVSDEDNEGYNTVQLARLWKQRESERKLFRHQWMARTGRTGQRQSIKSKTEVKAEI